MEDTSVDDSGQGYYEARQTGVGELSTTDGLEVLSQHTERQIYASSGICKTQ